MVRLKSGGVFLFFVFLFFFAEGSSRHIFLLTQTPRSTFPALAFYFLLSTGFRLFYLVWFGLVFTDVKSLVKNFLSCNNLLCYTNGPLSPQARVE